MSNGGNLKRDTIQFFNKDFSEMKGYLWVSPASSLLWSETTFGSIMQKATKRQGLSLYNNDIIQIVGGQWNPKRDKTTETYHLQGVQQFGPSGEIVNNYTYTPKECLIT